MCLTTTVELQSMRLWSNGYVLYSPSVPVIAVRYEGDKGNSFSDWVTNDKEAEAVQERLRTLLRVLHSNQSVEKPRNLSGKLAKFVLKKRLGVGLLGSLTTCTFPRLVHVSLGQRMVFVRLINETEPLQ